MHRGTVLQVSKGFTYTFDIDSAPVGSSVSDIKLNGAAARPGAPTYRVTANNFLTSGGDGFTVFTAGTDIRNGVIDLDALVALHGRGAADRSPRASGGST